MTNTIESIRNEYKNELKQAEERGELGEFLKNQLLEVSQEITESIEHLDKESLAKMSEEDKEAILGAIDDAFLKTTFLNEQFKQ